MIFLDAKGEVECQNGTYAMGRSTRRRGCRVSTRFLSMNIIVPFDIEQPKTVERLGLAREWPCRSKLGFLRFFGTYVKVL